MPKYAIYGAHVGRYRSFSNEPDARWVSQESGTVRYFSAVSLALHFINEQPDDMGPIEIHRIEETPGETRREVVELEDGGDFKGLKFALGITWGASYAPRGYILLQSDGDVATDVADAHLYRSLSGAVNAIHILSKTYAWDGWSIFGVREITTPATLKAIPLA